MAISPGGRPADASPIGHGGDNWVTRTGGLPTYVREIAHALMRKGMDESRAIATAVATVKRWAAGGGNVSPKVRAAAVKTVAEWEAKKAASHVNLAVASEGPSMTSHFDVNDLDLSAAVAAGGPAAGSAQQAPARQGGDFNALHPRGGKGTTAGGKFVKKGSTSPRAEHHDTSSRKSGKAGKGGGKGKAKTVTIRHGDTLSELAQRHGTTVDAIMAANPQIKNRDLIYAGANLRIPAPHTPGHDAGHDAHAEHHGKTHPAAKHAASSKTEHGKDHAAKSKGKSSHHDAGNAVEIARIQGRIAKLQRRLAALRAHKAGNTVNLATIDADDLDLAAEMLEDDEILVDLSQLDDDDAALLLDLAPGDYRPPYDWKHGYIPITPAAALSKAKGNRVRAAKLMGGKHARPVKVGRKDVPILPRRRLAGERSASKRAAAVDQAGRGRGTHTEQVTAHRAALADASPAELQRHKASSDAALADAAQAEIRARGQRKSAHDKATSQIGVPQRNAAPPVESTPAEKAHAARSEAAFKDRQAAKLAEMRAKRQAAPAATPAAGTRKLSAADVQTGDVVHTPPLMGKPGKRLRVDKAHEPKSDGSRNVDVTNLDTGTTHELTLEAHKEHVVARGSANPNGKSFGSMTPAEKIAAAEQMHGTGSKQHRKAQMAYGAADTASSPSTRPSGQPARDAAMRGDGLGQNTAAEDAANAATARKVNTDALNSLPWTRSSVRGGQPAVSYSPKHEKTLQQLEANGLIRMDRRGTSAVADDQYVLTDKGKGLVGGTDLHAQTQDRARAELAKSNPAVAAKTEAAGRGVTIGSEVDARQPGIENVTKGRLVGFTPQGFAIVEHTDRHGNKVHGTFNPAHVSKGDTSAVRDKNVAEMAEHARLAEQLGLPPERASRYSVADLRRKVKEAGSPKGGAGDTPAAETPVAHDGPTVEHTPDGTLVHNTSRDDKATNDALKANGFKWSRNLGAWYLPRTWGESTRNERVRRLEASLGDKIQVDRQTGPRRSAAEREAETRARAADRADRMGSKAEKLAAESEARRKASDAATEGIPFGQPILVGHHSQRRHERALEKSRTNMDKSWQAQKDSDAAAAAAERARRTAEGAESPVTTRQRIARKEAELRSVEKKLADEAAMQQIEDKVGADHPTLQKVAHTRLSPARKQQLEDARTELNDEIAHSRAKLDASGAKTYGKDSVSAGDFVKVNGSWYPVTKANAKTVGIPSVVGGSWDDKAPWDKVTDHKRAADMTPEQLDKLAAAATHPGVKAALEKHAATKRAGVPSKGETPPPPSVPPAQVPNRDQGPGAGDVPRLDASTARRMSDDQLEKALTRLIEAGGTDSAALQVIEDEMTRREAANRGKGDAAAAAASTPDPSVEAAVDKAHRTPSALTPEIVARMDQSQLERSLATLLQAGYDDQAPVMARLVDALEVKDKRAAATYRRGGANVERDANRARRAEHGTQKQQRADYATYIEDLAHRAQASDMVGAHATRIKVGGPSITEVLTMAPAGLRKHATPELLEFLALPGNRPLPFDAWRAAHRGATDRRAVAALARRREQWLSEYG